MGTHILSSSISNGIILTRDGSYLAPFTITQSGTITSAATGVYSTVATTGTLPGAILYNAGVVTGGEFGVDLTGAGDVHNSGMISATGYGVLISGTGTGSYGEVVNAGTISGGIASVKFFDVTNPLVVVDPGAVFVGLVEGDPTALHDTLELSDGTGSTGGTLTGLGTQIINFNTIDFANGWRLDGSSAGFENTTIRAFFTQDVLDVTDLATSVPVTMTLGASGVLGIPEPDGKVLNITFGSFDVGAFFTLTSDGSGGTDIIDNVPPNDPAEVGLSISGPGGLTGGGITNNTLILGTVTQGSAPLTESFGIRNLAKSPADLLKGTLSISGTTSAFTNNGAISFSGIVGGGVSRGHTISLNTGTIGTFSETVVLSASSYYGSNYSMPLTPDTLVVVGTVVAAGAAVGVPSPTVMSFAASAWMAATTAAPTGLLTAEAYAPAIGGSLSWSEFAAGSGATGPASADFFGHGLTTVSAAGDAFLGLGGYDVHKASLPDAWATPTLAS